MKLRTTFADFYARYDVLFEVCGGIALAALAYADRMPFWLILVLISIRQITGMIGMRHEQKKAE